MDDGRGTVRVITRIVLAVFAIQTVPTALWGLFSPRGWFDNFPGGGRHWVSVLGPFNEHLTRDYASAMFGIGVLLAWAAITMDRRLVQAALVTVAFAALPHAAYHLTTTDHYGTSDNILALSGLWAEVIIPLILLFALRNPAAATGAERSGGHHSSN